MRLRDLRFGPKGQGFTLKTIVVIILLLVTALAILIFLRSKFGALSSSYDDLFGKSTAIIDSIPTE